MKVIDIFNKIANGEEVRFRLLCVDDIFELTKDCTLYNETQKKEVQWCIDEDWLNKEVKIIEEKKIPEKIKDKYCSQISKVELAQKYNEIIDYLKSKGDE